jgi:hypothetical protein
LRGALDLIGNRYYQNDFSNQIQQDSYRQVLRIMAEYLDGSVSRTKIKSKFKGKDTTLNNALKALPDRHIILSKEGAKAIYRRQHKGFALWIKLFADPDFLRSLFENAASSETEPQEQTSLTSKSRGL